MDAFVDLLGVVVNLVDSVTAVARDFDSPNPAKRRRARIGCGLLIVAAIALGGLCIVTLLIAAPGAGL